MSKRHNTSLTPVIIPSHNESRYIAATLRSLPAERVYPIVADNGSTDNTAEIAEQFGAVVLKSDRQGKLPAIQHAMRHLGAEAVNPLIILDADTKPLMPKHWHDEILKSLTTAKDAPSGVGTLAWFKAPNPIYSGVHSYRRMRHAYRYAHGISRDSACYGPSMALNLNNDKALEQALALPHIWPGEDRVLTEVVIQNGGTYYQLLTPRAAVTSPISESVPGLVQSWRLGRERSHRAAQEAYAQRGAADSIPYSVYKKSQGVH